MAATRACLELTLSLQLFPSSSTCQTSLVAKSPTLLRVSTSEEDQRDSRPNAESLLRRKYQLYHYPHDGQASQPTPLLSQLDRGRAHHHSRHRHPRGDRRIQCVFSPFPSQSPRLSCLLQSGLYGQLRQAGRGRWSYASCFSHLSWCVAVSSELLTLVDLFLADGPANLLEAVTTAASPEAKGRGALIVLNDRISQAFYTSKTNVRLSASCLQTSCNS